MKKRVLYYVPMIHYPKHFTEDIELKKREYQARMDLVKEKLEKEIQKDRLDCKKLFIYSDGWEDPQPLKNVSESARQKIDPQKEQDTRIIIELIDEGATLMPTENKYLLSAFDKNIEMIKKLDRAVGDLDTKTENSDKDLKRWDKEWEKIEIGHLQLMMLRDEYVARKIDETLPADGIGILFMGEAHRVIEKLSPAKFKVIYLLEE